MKIKIKNIYEKPEKADGIRVLVDRLWPRGLRKERAGIDLWLKDIAPVQKSGNGLIMTRLNGMSSGNGTVKNLKERKDQYHS
jgi:hypothetical protein